MKAFSRDECLLVQNLLAHALDTRGYLTNDETVLATELTDVLAPPVIPAITGETTFDDYCRWESGTLAEVHDMYEDWLADLEAVGAEIGSRYCGDTSCEINYTLTLRQAYRIGWGFDSYGPPDLYLASQLVPNKYLDYGDPDVKRVAAEITALFDKWADETRTAGFFVQDRETLEKHDFGPEEEAAARARFVEFREIGHHVVLYRVYAWTYEPEPGADYDDPPLPDLLEVANPPDYGEVEEDSDDSLGCCEDWCGLHVDHEGPCRRR